MRVLTLSIHPLTWLVSKQSSVGERSLVYTCLHIPISIHCLDSMKPATVPLRYDVLNLPHHRFRNNGVCCPWTKTSVAGSHSRPFFLSADFLRDLVIVMGKQTKQTCPQQDCAQQLETEATQVPVDGQMNKMSCCHTVECLLFILEKGCEFDTHAGRECSALPNNAVTRE